MNITFSGKGKRAFLFYILITGFIFCRQFVSAQQNFNILHFTNDNFLPQSSASRVAFDKYGYTWISSQFGLVRYDGSHFRTYNTFNTKAVKSNRFTNISSDAKGNLYAVDGRPVVMQLTDSGFIDLPGLKHEQDCFFSVQFVNFKDLVKGGIDPFKNHKLFTENDAFLTFFRIDSLTFYFTSQKFTGYFDGKKLHTHLLDGAINSFINNGLLFVLLKNGAFNIYKQQTQVASGLKVAGDIISNERFNEWGIPSAAFNSAPDSNAYVYLNHALYILSGNSSQVTSRLVCDSVQANECIYIGYNPLAGSYYLCSAVEGLYILEPKIFKSLTIPSSAAKPNSNAQYAVIEAGNNKVLSANNYVFENKKVLPFTTDILSRFCLYRDPDYHIFFQHREEIYETDTSFNILAKYPLGSGVELKCMNKDGKGNLWVAIGNRLGMLKNGPGHFSYREFPFKHIESFVIQHDSLIWLAASDGLFLFHTQNQELEEIKKLKDNYVRALKLDNDGTLWIGTYGQGFYRYKEHHLVKFPADKNGYLSMAHCFMEDKNGFFWISTNRGLFQVKKSDLNSYADGKSKTVYYQYYDKNNGFTTNEFNGGCNPTGIQISDGSFILPSINGLVKFNPGSISPILPSGPILIDKVFADSISYSPLGSFSLHPRFHQLVFEVSSVYYGNPYNNNIEYHIEGLNDDWYALNDDLKITFTSLPHGSYTLQLRRLAGFGPDNYVYKNISFKVAPEFFETIWFRLLALLLLIILIWLGFRVRYTALRKQKLALEIQVAERTAALQRSVQDLQQSENSLYSSIQQKEKITSILLHDLKSPLRFLTLVSDHIYSEIDHGKKAYLKKLTLDIMNSSRRISMVTDEFLAWLVTDYKDYTVSNESILLKPLTDEIADFFGELVESNNNTLVVDVKENLKVIADARLLRVILRNLIDNANKHTRRGTISVEAFSIDGITEIKVSDTGKGMTAEQLKSFSNADSNTLGFSLHIGNQLGSRIIRDFINKLGGLLTATSETGKGTTITLSFKN